MTIMVASAMKKSSGVDSGPYQSDTYNGVSSSRALDSLVEVDVCLGSKTAGRVRAAWRGLGPPEKPPMSCCHSALAGARTTLQPTAPASFPSVKFDTVTFCSAVKTWRA